MPSTKNRHNHIFPEIQIYWANFGEIPDILQELQDFK